MCGASTSRGSRSDGSSVAARAAPIGLCGPVQVNPLPGSGAGVPGRLRLVKARRARIGSRQGIVYFVQAPGAARLAERLLLPLCVCDAVAQCLVQRLQVGPWAGLEHAENLTAVAVGERQLRSTLVPGCPDVGRERGFPGVAQQQRQVGDCAVWDGDPGDLRMGRWDRPVGGVQRPLGHDRITCEFTSNVMSGAGESSRPRRLRVTPCRRMTRSLAFRRSG